MRGRTKIITAPAAVDATPLTIRVSGGMARQSATRKTRQPNPLRCVVKREIVRYQRDWGLGNLIYNETLECGHPYTTIPISDGDICAHRRRCAACGEAARRAALPAARRKTA